ncbi:hypothetical protein [Acaryochloris sp. IP29b_bin.137]|uniref:hypothetical protein n=1 Tax=Acaryochloris sp. IP29b_bin.137 TaxID=2969217 RepID=UPI002620859C|nr:hypothetical protein [Acaryochloris sp. IP29b_bin.137]
MTTPIVSFNPKPAPRTTPQPLTGRLSMCGPCDEPLEGTGEGSSKQEAKTKAARGLLAKINRHQ